MTEHVTKHGRAISLGRVFRRCQLVRTRCRHQEQPLPVELQCHPKALTPTPVHPNCRSSAAWRGRAQAMMRDWTKRQMLSGIGLLRAAHVGRDMPVYVSGRCRGFAEPMEALAWVRAAHAMGIKTAECRR